MVSFHTWLGLIGVDDQEGRAAVGLLGHEGPLQSGGKARATAAAQTRRLQLVHYPVGSCNKHIRAVGCLDTLEIDLKSAFLPWHRRSFVRYQSPRFMAAFKRQSCKLVRRR
jgi:hypothetical protein